MSEDKEQRTEEPTPKRREKARGEGETARSQDVTAVATFIGAGAALVFTGASASLAMARQTAGVLGNLDAPTYWPVVSETYGVLVQICLPVCLSAMAAALVGGFAQVGWNPTAKAFKPNFKKLDPVKNLKRMLFSTSSLFETAKAVAKLIFIGAIVGGTIYRAITSSGGFANAESGEIMRQIGTMAFDLSWRAAIGMLILALVDFAWQRHQHEKSLKMTRHEIKEEHKESEGDPMVRGRRKRLQREAANRRAEAQLGDASVVVVNPTHVAVALRYKPPKDHAPVVVAKGIDDVALQVRQEARRRNIPIHHDPPLARRLARKVALGRPVPPELYKAVAAVLAAVLRVRNPEAA